MKTSLDNLTESERFIVKWQYGLLGHFKTALIEAIKLADDDNLENLRLGFPVEVFGYINYSRTPGWWQEVQRKIGKEADE